MHDWKFWLGWYVVGILLSLYWPIKYRKGMAGSWGSFFWQLPFTALFGPFAIIAAFPV